MFIHRWNDQSIRSKLYFVVGLMAVLIVVELIILTFSMHTLSAVRAFVGAEGNWSKAQKNADICLGRYALSLDEEDYRCFLDSLRIPAGDHQARVELEKERPDIGVARAGFIEGQISPDDVDGVITLIRRFYWAPYLSSAIKVWVNGDSLLDQFRESGDGFHSMLKAGGKNREQIQTVSKQLNVLNAQLTTLENTFSDTLGEGSRWLEHLVISLLFLAVLLVESVGLTLTFLTSRSLSKGLVTLEEVAKSIGAGDFRKRALIHSRDEIGALAESLNSMGELLETSYSELETRVLERTSELREALQLRERFVATLTHDLRNPLSVARAGAQMLLMTKEDPEKNVGRIISSIDRTEEMIRDILDAHLIQASQKLPLELSQCDLRAIAIESIADLALAHGNRFQLKASGALLGFWAPKDLRRMIDNLLVNAVKYGDSNTPITLTLESLPGNVRMRVHNEGKGLSAEEQISIFEPFRRTAAAAHGAKKGWGLGLTLVRGIIETHGGRISVESVAGKGTTFVVELPSDSRPYR